MSEQDKRAEEVRVTGGYEPNDPVVLSREEYHAALRQAYRDGAGEMWALATRTWPSWDSFDAEATNLLKKGGE